VAHGYAADALGDPTARLSGRLTLNPLPHIDPLGSIILPAILALSGSSILFGWAKPVPYNPYNLRNGRFGELLVAAAGPGTNIFIAVVFGLILRFGNVSGPFFEFASIVILINLMLAFFNLIPIPPLDGSKILINLLPFRAAYALRSVEEKLYAFGPLGSFLGIFLVIYVIWQYVGWIPSFFFVVLTGQLP
jgi:Zn-dependent protease